MARSPGARRLLKGEFMAETPWEAPESVPMIAEQWDPASVNDGASALTHRTTYAYGPSAVDYEARINFDALRSERVARVQERLRASELDALLVFKDENVRFLTGLRAQIIAGKSTQLNGALLLPDQPPILLVSGGDLQRAREAMPWITEFHPIPIMEDRGLLAGFARETFKPLLQRLELDRSMLGIDTCAFALVQELRRNLPDVELDDGDALMLACRAVKSEAELAVMEEASAIAEAVTSVAIASIRPGMRETEVAGEAMRELYRLGGEGPHVTTPFVASGEHMAPPNRMCTDKVIREGDLVFIDIGAMWCGYFADLGRTVVCGEPSARQREVFTAVYEALEAGTAAMKPGATNVEVATAITDVAEHHDLAQHFIPLFIGHGVGVGANEPPYVGETLPGAQTVVLEAGMTLALEPLIWVPGIRGGGGVRLEDTILVEEHGGRPLTRMGFDQRLLLTG
jgi:Xaa-Pro aminopeptidase